MDSRDRANVVDGANKAPDRAQPIARPSEVAAAAIGDPMVLDHDAIFAAISEIPYEWRIDSDVLTWGRNVHGVLAPLDPAALASGKAYAGLIDPQSGPSRSDAIMRCGPPRRR